MNTFINSKSIVRSLAILPFLTVMMACSDGGGLSGGGTGIETGGLNGTSHCYKSASDHRCECVAENEDDSRPASTWTKVSSCNESTFGKRLACNVDTTVDGTTTQCGCSVIRCTKSEGGACGCGQAQPNSDSETSSCSGFEWYCARTDGTSCYGGNGNFGSACGNDEHNVASCSLSMVKADKEQVDSCDGLKWAAPKPADPSPPSSSSKPSSGCHSNSDCHDKCKRCELSTGSCVSKLTC